MTPEDVWYTSFDGRKIETWINEAGGFTPARSTPWSSTSTAVRTPPTATSSSTKCNAGRAGLCRVYPNPRGSTTYGQEFGNIIQYKYPGDDYKDLMVAVDSVIRRGYVDSTNWVVTGGSAAAAHRLDGEPHASLRGRGVAARRGRLAGFLYTADFTLFQPSWFRSTPFRDPQEYLARSPVRYADSVTTP